MTLTFGSGGLVRVVRDPVTLLIAYRGDSGTDYLNFRPTTPIDVLLPEDLAVTILIMADVARLSGVDGGLIFPGQILLIPAA